MEPRPAALPVTLKGPHGGQGSDARVRPGLRRVSRDCRGSGRGAGGPGAPTHMPALSPPSGLEDTMSAQEERGWEPPKPKGKVRRGDPCWHQGDPQNRGTVTSGPGVWRGFLGGAGGL